MNNNYTPEQLKEEFQQLSERLLKLNYEAGQAFFILAKMNNKGERHAH